ncbi:MAG TPA: STAS/SEC14 domain-containing protein [Candidatus Saccharimonadales bacterium]|nr:STAS/SEC14 domain-containing protein [Candidatus Saccharimonadales bacterium]
MDGQEKQFSVDLVGNYIHLKTWGKLEIETLDAPANAALSLSQEHHIDKLLDDIREVDSSNASIHIQTKAMGILWKLRTFRKVAIVLQGSRLQTLFFATLEALHLNLDSKFKGFENEAEAIAWLQED